MTASRASAQNQGVGSVRQKVGSGYRSQPADRQATGGAAPVESRKGVATMVRIQIPRKDGPLAGPEASAEGHSGAAAGGERILVVEDDPDVREMTLEMLSELGYRVSVARSGAEALAILRQKGEIDLLFTDIVMPGGISGTDLARTASRLRPDLKILLTSGYEPGARAARKDFAFIAKPYRAPALGRKLREILAAGA